MNLTPKPRPRHIQSLIRLAQDLDLPQRRQLSQPIFCNLLMLYGQQLHAMACEPGALGASGTPAPSWTTGTRKFPEYPGTGTLFHALARCFCAAVVDTHHLIQEIANRIQHRLKP